MSSSNSSEVGHVGNGTHWESLMNQSIVDKHVGHPEHRDSKPLLQHQNAIIQSFQGYYCQINYHSQLTDPNETVNEGIKK